MIFAYGALVFSNCRIVGSQMVSMSTRPSRLRNVNTLHCCNWHRQRVGMVASVAVNESPIRCPILKLNRMDYLPDCCVDLYRRRNILGSFVRSKDQRVFMGKDS